MHSQRLPVGHDTYCLGFNDHWLMLFGELPTPGAEQYAVPDQQCAGARLNDGRKCSISPSEPVRQRGRRLPNMWPAILKMPAARLRTSTG
jgi:hypothetical protein